jgi:hypothetical protein
MEEKMKINTPFDKKKEKEKGKKPLTNIPCTPNSSRICQPLSTDHRSYPLYKVLNKSQCKALATNPHLLL